MGASRTTAARNQRSKKSQEGPQLAAVPSSPPTLQQIAASGGHVGIPAAILIELLANAERVPAPPEGFNCRSWMDYLNRQIPSILRPISYNNAQGPSAPAGLEPDLGPKE